MTETELPKFRSVLNDRVLNVRKSVLRGQKIGVEKPNGQKGVPKLQNGAA